MIPHIEVELTLLFNDDDLRYVIEKQFGGNGRKFKQVMVPADCSDSIEMDIPLGMGNLAASLGPQHKVLREMVLEHFISTGGLHKYVNPDELLDPAIDDQIEADDQAGELNSYMMQKWVVDTGSDYDHPGDSVEVINAIYNDGNETTEPESVPKGRSKGMSAAVPDLVKAVILNSVSGDL